MFEYTRGDVMADRVFGGQLAQLLMQLSSSQESGVLALFSNRKRLNLMLYRGRIMGVSAPKGYDSFDETLRRNGVINGSDKERVRSLVAADGEQGGSDDSWALGAALQISTVMSENQLRKMHQQRQQSLLLSAISWRTGRWRFSAKEPTAMMSEGLLWKQSIPALLWRLFTHPAQRAITIDEMLTVTGTEIGGFQVAPELRANIQEHIDAFQLPQELAAVGETLAAHQSALGVETLSMACPAAGERSTIAAWLFYAVGILRKIDEVFQPLPFSGPEEASDQAEPGVGLSTKEQRLIDTVHRDYQRLLNKDAYAFLKLHSTASAQDLEKKCTSRRKTLRFLLTKVPGISDETRRCIEDLDAGVKVAWHFLGDRARRRVYDRALRTGKIGPICPRNTEADYTDVRRKLARREFEEAFEMLTTKPLTASTFALRGWCGWQLSKLELESELDLAARLDEQNRDVIEYNLRLAIDKQSASLILRWADLALRLTSLNLATSPEQIRMDRTLNELATSALRSRRK